MANGASNIDFRTSQSYALGAGGNPAAQAGTLNFQAARNLILGRLNVSVGQPVNAINGLVTALTVQGASIFASNQPCAIRGFHTSLQMDENFIGVPIPTSGVAQMQYAGVLPAPGGSSVAATIMCDPWQDSLGAVPSPDESGPSALNYAFGLSQVVIGAGATANIQGTALRACVLGRLYLEAFDAAAGQVNAENQCLIDSIVINQTEQLGSQVNAGATLESFSLNALSSMANLNQFVPLNGTVTITITNNSAAAQTVHGHFFCNAS
tara:strand:+ start:3510 stop:4307 length:798 start_codon:yes stop_codon:yes gene_type:complete